MPAMTQNAKPEETTAVPARRSTRATALVALGAAVLTGALVVPIFLSLIGGNTPAHAALGMTPVMDDKDSLVGKPAPDFSLPDQNDKQVKLSSNKGKWVVLAFYPADMTPGCTLQNRSYSQHIAEFAPKNAVVYTVSTQDTSSKRAFCSKEDLKHTLLSDVGGNVAKQFGALMPTGAYASRWTYYIKPDGTVAYVDKSISPAKAAEDSLALLDKLEKEGK